MDSAIAALLGSGIGAVVALGGTIASYRQVKLQVRSDAKLALREPRRKVYNDFLLLCREAVDALWEGVDEETGTIPSGLLSMLVEGRSQALERALGAVDLEGPTEVSKAAHVVVDAIGELGAQAEGAWRAGLAHDEDGFGGAFTVGITKALEKYVERARSALATYADAD